MAQLMIVQDDHAARASCGRFSPCRPRGSCGVPQASRCSYHGTSCVCHVGSKRGVLLLNLGTPDGPDPASVKRYLKQFLSDPFVISLPGRWKWATGGLARTIATFRAKQSAHAYSTIWTPEGSPLKVITEKQVKALQAELGGKWRVTYAMRYQNPSLASALDGLAAEGVTDVVVVPMYPQYSGPTTGTALAELYAELSRRGTLDPGAAALRINLTVRNTWYDDANYVEATARLIHRHVTAAGLDPSRSFLLYSTHSMPQAYVDAGDPYEGQVRRTMELLNRRLGWPSGRTTLSFQSKLGPVPWLGPSTERTLDGLAAAGEKDVFVCPISFTADCLETLEEIAVGYAEQFAEKSDGGRLRVIPANNDDPAFIRAVAHLVRRGPTPLRTPGDPAAGGVPPTEIASTLFDADVEPRDTHEKRVASLVVVSVCRAGRLGTGDGPKLTYADDPTFLALKRPQQEAGELLRQAIRTGAAEAWLWNTCNRSELYAWPGDGVDNEAFGERLALLLAGEADAPRLDAVNRLHGQTAWHHLLRSAAGLNSRLPGDTEVLEQLDSAVRMAEHVGTAGRRTRDLVGHAIRVVRRLRAETAWGEFAHDYCSAAMGDWADLPDIDWRTARVTVIGGSTTSRSLLRWLVGPMGVPSQHLTAVYRGVGRERLAKTLRKIMGHGRRLRVHEYDAPEVRQAIGGSDVLFLGIDRRRPILTADDVRPLRDFANRPLWVIDFNTFGSTDGLEGVPFVRLVPASALADTIAGFADDLAGDDAFREAVREAQAFLRDDAGLTPVADVSPAREVLTC